MGRFSLRTWMARCRTDSIGCCATSLPFSRMDCRRNKRRSCLGVQHFERKPGRRIYAGIRRYGDSEVRDLENDGLSENLLKGLRMKRLRRDVLGRFTKKHKHDLLVVSDPSTFFPPDPSKPHKIPYQWVACKLCGSRMVEQPPKTLKRPI